MEVQYSANSTRKSKDTHVHTHTDTHPGEETLLKKYQDLRELYCKIFYLQRDQPASMVLTTILRKNPHQDKSIRVLKTPKL